MRARWRLISPASLLFTQPFIQAQVKENTKAPRHVPLCGEITGDCIGEFPARMASNAENVTFWWRHHGQGTRIISRTMFGWRHAHWPLRPEQIDRKQLQWRHNERDDVSNHRRHCLLKSLFMRRSKKISRLRVTGHCKGNPPVTGGFPS